MSLENNYSLHSINLYDNQLQNETANTILNVLRTNKSLLYLNVECNRIQLKMINEITNALKINIDLQKNKYLPQLKSSIKSLQFHPEKLDEMKAHIKAQNEERKLLTFKIEEDLNMYSKEKEKLRENLKEIELENQILVSRIQELNQEINDIETERNEDKITMTNQEKKIRDRLEIIDEDITKIERILKDQQNKINQTKEEQKKEIFNVKLNLQDQINKMRLSEVSFKKESENFAKKKHDFENGLLSKKDKESSKKKRRKSEAQNPVSSLNGNKVKRESKINEQILEGNGSTRNTIKKPSMGTNSSQKSMRKSSSAEVIKEITNTKEISKKKQKTSESNGNMNNSTTIISNGEKKN